MKKKEVNINEESTSAGGAHAVNKFRISDFVMMAVIVILCASCVLPFLHVAVKSISGNTAVMSKSVYFWPKDITFDAYKKVFADNSMTYSMIFSVIVTVIFTALGMLDYRCYPDDWTFERSGPDGMIALIFWGDYRYGSYDIGFVFERYVDLDERWLFDLAKDPEGRKPTVTWQTYNRGGVLYESYDEMFISLLPRKVETRN